MAAHTCAFRVAVVLLLATTTRTEQTKEKWSKPVQEAEGRSDWIPVASPYRDTEVAAQEDVATILRPPEPITLRQQRLVQSPRQARGPPPGIPQPYFQGDQSHLIRFPDEPSPQLRVPHAPSPQHFQNPNFRGPQPVFLQPQSVPAGFPPQGLTHSPFQPQPIPAFNSKPVTSQHSQNKTFVSAGPEEEVQLVYVPVEALQGPKIPNKQKNQPPKQFKNPEDAFQEQLRQFVSEQSQLKPHIPNSQEIFEQEKLRSAVIREQEERRRLQEQEIKERQEQEAKIRKEQEERNRKEQEQRLRKEQEYRERQEQEARARKEQELRLKLQKEAKEEEERSRFEAEQRFQQQQQQDQNRRPQFAQNNAANLQSKENAFQQQLQSQSPQSPPTTPAPHQPPLAVYMGGSGRTPAVIDDVLFALRDVHTIPVLDRVPDANNPPPRVFVGPAEMRLPEGYSKFDLPYLSSLDSNRVERKVDQLPFFVAPLSYSPPTGYAKIPFPEPHVGSVVVSQRGRQQRPVSPDPIPVSEEYAEDDIPTINPAIPLLVNSLQNGRGQKAQRPHVQQQFLSQDQFLPHNQFVQQQQFVPHHIAQQNHFIPHQAPQFLPHPPQQEAQFIPQQVFEEEIPVVTETEAPPTTTERVTTRRPVNTRGRTRQQLSSTTQSPRTRAPSYSGEQTERRPVNRGRRPVSRGRTTTTTTPEPVTEQEQVFESSHESNQEEQAPLVNTRPSSVSHSQPPLFKHHTASQPQVSETEFNQPQFQDFEPSTHRQFPLHQQGQGVHALPVQPVVTPQFEDTVTQRPQHQAPSRGNAFQQAQEEFYDPNFGTQRYEIPQHEPAQPHFRTRQQEFQQIPVSEEQPILRSRPGVFQPVVSSTPASLLTRHAEPSSTPTYPSVSPSIKPHHVSKGEVGKVKHVPTYPFVPTALPENESSPASSIETDSYRFSPEPEIPLPTAEPAQVGVQYVSATPTPLSYQTPSRPRVKTQDNEESEEAAIATTPRPRARVTSDSAEQTTPSYHSSQRFRGRGQTSREETNDEITTVAPQRVRPRVNTVRGRVTATERPRGLQITVADIPKSAPSDDTQTETPRVRGRFRGVDRGTTGRQQLTTRGRKPVNQQESSGIDLAQPVRQQSSSTEIPSNESPVYIPDVKLESGFVPAIDSQRALPTTTEKPYEPATTEKPVRGRFNNFGTGNRVSQRRPVSRGSTSTAADTATEAPTSSRVRDYNVVRSSRRQQPQRDSQQSTRVTSLRGGSRIRRPTTEAPQPEEEAVTLATGVSYVKNPYVTILRPTAEQTPAAAPEEDQEEHVKQQAPPSRVRSQRPKPVQEEEESYVEPVSRFNANKDDQAAPTRVRSQRPKPVQEEEERYVEPVSRYTASPPEPEYEPQFYSPLPSRAVAQNQEKFFAEVTPNPSSPRQHFSARASTAQPQQQYHKEVVPQQYHREEFEYQEPEAPRQHRQRNNVPTRYITLDDPENPEYGEESQRSEQISIQQLEGALTASLFNKSHKDEVVDEEEKVGEFVDSELAQVAPILGHEEEISTEENETSETVTTEEPLRVSTLSLDEVTTTTPEPEKTSEKPALHSKSNEGRRRRVRVRTRVHRPGDLFETAESVNVHSIATNSVNKKVAHDKNIQHNEWNKPTTDVSDESNEEEYPYEVKLSPPNYATIDNSNFDDDEAVENVDDLIHITTESPEIESTEENLVTSTISPVRETTTPLVEVLTTTEAPQTTKVTTEMPQTTQSEATTTPEYSEVSTTETVTTDTESPVTSRLLGTSTTTEISLETEICYRGRCVKTKVDADQKPILTDDQMPIDK